ncbi:MULTISPECIES: YdaS family helix-turn-helix protein [unclassified Caballeronia]|uniref:transcriptional regulator n=1 Tax=unclassified Caballeronia TaxID=2646786 RepID=UPI0020280157|nr:MULTISPECIES: YdaS family helix-turn-helix protein [unclassified Caballeronia]
MTTKNESIERAISHFGSLSAMARELGLSSYQVIQEWRKNGRVPPEHCSAVERATGERSEALNGRIDWSFYRRSKKAA